jgi:hypothetical protein
MPTAAKINGPTRHLTDPAYLAECKFALGASVDSLMEQAVTAGWDPRGVAYSIMILAAEKVQELSKPNSAPELD